MELNTSGNTTDDARTKQLEFYFRASQYLVFWCTVELLLILVGVVNLVCEGYDNSLGQFQMLIGIAMVIGHILWVRRVNAFLDEKPESTGDNSKRA